MSSRMTAGNVFSRSRLSGFSLQLILSSMVLIASLYLNSGTLAPYAATLFNPLIDPARGYLYNLDHDQFKSVFLMLDGAPRAAWENSWMLRRVLFYWFGYFPMKSFGYEMGGLITSILLHVLSFVGFIFFVRKKVGKEAAIVGMWLLAFYPGVPYFGTLPYTYATIFPGSLALLILCLLVADADSPWKICLYAWFSGMLFLAYDLQIFFLPALAVVLLGHRRLPWPVKIGSALLTMLPLAGWLLALRYHYGVSLWNTNSGIYKSALLSYVTNFQSYALYVPAWQCTVSEQIVRTLPYYFLHTFFFSAFFWVPALFALYIALGWTAFRAFSKRIEMTILATGLVFFLFNNLAPPYGGWQMRGEIIARLYEPLFAVWVLLILKIAQREFASRCTVKKCLLILLTIVAVTGNGCVSFGAYLGDSTTRYACRIYHEFYRHSHPLAYYANVRYHGKRPLGF